MRRGKVDKEVAGHGGQGGMLLLGEGTVGATGLVPVPRDGALRLHGRRGQELRKAAVVWCAVPLVQAIGDGRSVQEDGEEARRGPFNPVGVVRSSLPPSGTGRR